MNELFQRRIYRSHNIWGGGAGVGGGGGGRSFWYYLKAFGHSVMSQEAPCWWLWGFYICLCILLLLLLLLLLLQLLLFLISFLLFLLLLEFLSQAAYCSYEVSWPSGFVSFNFFICLNLIHATTIWCWRTTSILSFGII